MFQFARINIFITGPLLDDTLTINLNSTAWDFVSVAGTPDTNIREFNNRATLAEAIAIQGGANYDVNIVGNNIIVDALNLGDQYTFDGSIEYEGGMGPSHPGFFIQSETPNIGNIFSVVPTVTHAMAHGASTGKILLAVNDGVSPYTYLWSNGAMTKDIVNIPAGFYTVTVTDSLGVEVTVENIEVTQPDTPITAEVEKTEPLCFGDPTGTITITPAGGVVAGDYQYQWADGPTTKDRTDLVAGTYILTITDDNGAQLIVNVVINQPDALQIIALIQGQDILITVLGGTPPYTYLWDDGPTDKDRFGLDEGSYTIVVTDDNGCSEEETINISPSDFSLSKNPVILSLDAGLNEGSASGSASGSGSSSASGSGSGSAPASEKPNLSFVCDVYIEKTYLSGSFEKVISLEQPAQSDGTTIFDVQAALDIFVSHHLPDPANHSMVRATNAFKRYRLDFAEKFGDPPVLDTVQQNQVRYVIHGGLSYEEWASKTFFETYLVGEFTPFLTWQPNNKLVFPDQPEYLYFMLNNFDTTTVAAKSKIYYLDGSDRLVNIHSFSPSDRYEIYMISCRPSLLAASYPMSDQLKKIEVWVEDQAATRISEIRTYIINNDYVENKRYFLYGNSVGGGYATLAAIGKITNTLKVTEQSTEKILDPDYSIEDGEIEILDKTGQNEIRVPVGNAMITREYLERLQDFIISESVYLYDTNRLVPVQIQSRSIRVVDENRSLAQLEFTYLPPQMRQYTPRL